MTIVELNRRLYTIPTAWDELSRKQLLGVISILYRNGELNTTLLQLFRILSGMNWLRFFLTKASDMMDFFYLVFFLVNETGPTKNIIKEHKGFHGPADDFNNLTGAEFIFSEDFYFAFVASEHKDDNALNELVAILYRPGKRNYDYKINPAGDTRQPYNQNISSFFAKARIKKWNRDLKLCIFHWYQACREKMLKGIPKGKSTEPAKYGLLSVMRTIAETGIHGDFEKVQQMYVKMWVMELNEKMAEAERIEKSNK